MRYIVKIRVRSFRAKSVLASDAAVLNTFFYLLLNEILIFQFCLNF